MWEFYIENNNTFNYEPNHILS